MRKIISLALVFTVLVTGLMLVLGALSTPSTSGVAKTPYISALSDAAVGNALAACKPSCTHMQPGPHPMPQQCFSTENCTDCVWFEDGYYIAVNCGNGH